MYIDIYRYSLISPMLTKKAFFDLQNKDQIFCCKKKNKNKHGGREQNFLKHSDTEQAFAQIIDEKRVSLKGKVS